MISMVEAEAAVQDRLHLLASDGEALTPEQLALLCAGTDIPGPELAVRVNLDGMELAHALVAMLVGESEDDPGEAIRGFLVRSFWLGYEFGKAGP